MKLKKFKVKNFRSLLDVEIDFINGHPVTISGENNIGKTNFLRALNIFFNHLKNKNLFNIKTDIPHHIYYGSRGGSTKTEFTAEFLDNANDIVIVNVKFNSKEEISYRLNNKIADSKEISSILERFHFFFIESHNIHLPSLINTILEKDGLLPLDKKRSQQSAPLAKLKEFIDLSKKAIDDIQKEINTCFKDLTDFDGFLKEANISINFAEFEKLRDAVKTMTSITLNDGNNHEIESKGSGAQRAVFLSLMKYISQNIKDKQIIWAIDEPEAFLQPKLQRQVFDTIKNMCDFENQTIILTTHSQHFINLNKINTINLFECSSELKEYKRRPGIKFHEISTKNVPFSSISEKVQAIKNHLGVKNNDGWELLPFNVLVEGEEDKKYLEKLINTIGKEAPNIIWSGGASKIGGYLQYYNNFAKDIPFSGKPKIICIFDNDEEGREQAKKINPSKLTHLEVSIIPLPRHDGKILSLEKINQKQTENWEIEDFLPIELMIKTANEMLRKNQYSTITKKQQNDRIKQAHINKMILDYLEECSAHRNPERESYEFNSQGRKKELCKNFCEKREINEISEVLTDSHVTFLNMLLNFNSH